MSSGDATRPYEMRARQDAVDETRERILEAMIDLWLERHYDDLTLADVAERADVSRQTIFRHFGAKDDVLAAAFLKGAQRAEMQSRVEPGDVAGALRETVARYEIMGDANVRSLEIEGRHPVIDEMLARGRAAHRAWLETVFALSETETRATLRRLVDGVLAGAPPPEEAP